MPEVIFNAQQKQPQKIVSNIKSNASVQSVSDVVHPLIGVTNQMTSRKGLLLIPLLIIIFGIGTGYLLANTKNTGSGGGILSKVTKPVTESLDNGSGVSEAGRADVQEFPDEAQGLLEKNDGSVTLEGTHRLIREGGPSQTAYLTSSVVDLSKFEGKQVQVKGETNTALTAGWFMDVGWIKEM